MASVKKKKASQQSASCALDNVDLNPISKLLSLQTMNGVIYRPSCKLCNSSHRVEAEQRYAHGDTVTSIKQWLGEQDEVIGVASVGRHLKEHFRNQDKMLALVEYCDDLAGMSQRRGSMVEDIKLTINVGFKEYARILTLQTRGDFSREKVRNDMLNKTWQNILMAYDKLRDMHSEDVRIQAIEENFIKSWTLQIESAKDEDERQAFVKTLQQFKELLEGN